MANEVVGVDINVKTNVEGSIGQLKALKKQLKDTAAGSEEFKRLTNEINDLEDKLKGAKQAAGDWVDQLASAPGPLGAVGNALNKLKVSTQSFGGALNAIGIGAFVAIVGGLVAAFAESEKATKKLQPLLIGLERIFNGIYAAVEPLFDAFIDLATKAMPIVTRSFGVAYSAITSFLQGLGSLGSAVSKLIKGDFSGAWDSATEAVTGFGKRYSEANERFMAGTKEVTKTEKEELDKRNEAAKQAAEERKKANEEILKNAIQSSNEILLLETKNEKQKAEIKLALQYEAEKKSIEQSKAGAKEKQEALKALDAKFVAQQQALNEEYKKKDEEKEKQFQQRLNEIKSNIRIEGITDIREKEREKLNQQLEQDIKKITEDETLKEEQRTALIEQLRISSKQKLDELNNKFAEEDRQKRISDELSVIKIIAEAENETFKERLDRYRQIREKERELLIEKKANAAELKAFDAETKKGEIERERSATETKLGIISDALGTIAEAVGKNTIAGKALSIAQATVDTYAGANKALSTYPPPWGAIAAGTVILAGLLNVRKIIATKIPKPPGSSVSDTATASVPSSAPITPSAPLINTRTQLDSVTIQQLGSATNRAYVLESDITNNQERIRRINRAARLG